MFFEDKDIDPRFRNKLEDFWQSGYDRGHLVRSKLQKEVVTSLQVMIARVQ